MLDDERQDRLTIHVGLSTSSRHLILGRRPEFPSYYRMLYVLCPFLLSDVNQFQ